MLLSRFESASEHFERSQPLVAPLELLFDLIIFLLEQLELVLSQRLTLFRLY